MPLLDGLLHSPGYLAFVILVMGMCVGSFLNVVAWRLPQMMDREWRSECRALLELPEAPAAPLTLSTPASHCPACKAPIKPWHNVPVFGWLALRGKCAACGVKISPRYPIVEAVTGVMSAYCAVHFGFSAALAASLVMTWCLIALTLIDLDTQLLPDSITLPLLWLGLLLSLGPVFVTPKAAIIGAAAGYLSLWSMYHLFRLATGKEGMGYGDFKLLGALGAWFGWQALPLIILMSSVVGAIVGLCLIVFRKHGRDVPIPFGPYLAAAGWLVLIAGNQIQPAWQSFFAP